MGEWTEQGVSQGDRQKFRLVGEKEWWQFFQQEMLAPRECKECISELPSHHLEQLPSQPPPYLTWPPSSAASLLV